MLEEITYLNQTEKEQIQQFLENKVLYEAVRKVILSGVYEDGKLEEGKGADVLKNFVLARFTTPNGMTPPSVSIDDDKIIGQKLRAIIDGISMVETGFQKLESLKKVEPEETKKVNRGK